MAIITISRGSYSKGKEVAERVAQTLGYECISREVLLEASEHFNIPEIKLRRALHDAPSILERFTYGKERYLAYITAAFLEHVHRDNIVYHGLAGQFFLKGISHVLKIRVLADMEDRAALEMKRDKVSRDEALRRLRRDDHERRQWSQQLFGADTWDASLYDAVLHVHRLTVDNVVNFICQTVQQQQFKATHASQQVLNDLLLAAQVKARLVDDCPRISIRAENQVVTIEAQFNQNVEPELAEKIKVMALQTPGVKEVQVHPV
ncbi:cytidylate kinase-like family protein [Desulfopila sp. IMCC35006]|uniref:cytidylate kinase-like family protein n=1 Tax=Desulfopila sp. IMCC35006 TaxID=2569542 RepID=UPI0010AC5E68|nr:cytidylate kinase-like family protein [Desulfopila sp. IMCC35006]TKB23678.1 cytidylate kinase-like family protein [Desulfopila sp. IMCC35006]